MERLMRLFCLYILVILTTACAALAEELPREFTIENKRIALELNGKSFGPKIYYKINGRKKLAASLRPAITATDIAVKLDTANITKNDDETIVLDASFRTESGAKLSIKFLVKQDMPTIEIIPSDNANLIKILADFSYTIMPDLFADDLVIDPRHTDAKNLYLPCDNQSLLGLIDDGDAIIVCNWLGKKKEITAAINGKKLIRETTIPLNNNGQNPGMWFSVLGYKDIWHVSGTAGLRIDNHEQLDWEVPFEAAWRANYRRIDNKGAGLTDSFWNARMNDDGTFKMAEALLQMEIIEGNYVVEGPQEQKRIIRRSVLNENTGSGWWTYRGWFIQPFFTDRGSAFIKLPKYDGTRAIRYNGSIIIYPLLNNDLLSDNAKTVEDILANTFGPEYLEIMDLHDLNKRPRKDYYPPTCTTTKYCEQIFEVNDDQYRREQIAAILSQMELFVRYTRYRLQEYLDWQIEVQALCDKNKTADDRLTAQLEQIEEIINRFGKQFTRAKRRLRSPEKLEGLADKVIALTNRDSRAKLKKYKQLSKQIRSVGNAQDELLGEFREIAKITRQRATLLYTQQPDPNIRSFLADVRTKTQEILRVRYDMEGK